MCISAKSPVYASMQPILPYTHTKLHLARTLYVWVDKAEIGFLKVQLSLCYMPQRLNEMSFLAVSAKYKYACAMLYAATSRQAACSIVIAVKRILAIVVVHLQNMSMMSTTMQSTNSLLLYGLRYFQRYFVVF